MKGKTKAFFAIVFALFCLMFCFSCKGEKAQPVVIDLQGVAVGENTTLLEVMEGLEGESKLKFTLKDGMVTAINGRKNSTNRYWMLYTSDEELSNAAWGTYTYEGKRLGSAVCGAGELIVKSGEVYVWVYQKF